MKDEFEKERKIKDERIASLEEKLKKSEDLVYSYYLVLVV